MHKSSGKFQVSYACFQHSIERGGVEVEENYLGIDVHLIEIDV